ncbi:MAG TPA: TIGR03435 family protein [Acidobacteriaceae bacterium]
MMRRFRRGKILRSVLFGVLVARGWAQGVTNPAQDGKAIANVEPGAMGHGFEVATVKLANRNDGRRMFGMMLAPSGRLTVSAMSLEGLVQAAYVGARVRGRVEGGSKWVDEDQWDIEAKLDETDMAEWEKLGDRERMDRVRPELRALLVERFGLKVHTETKVTPVYALVQAKGGVKMKEVEGPPANIKPEDREKWMRGGKEEGGPMPGSFRMSDKGWEGHAVEAGMLTGQIGYEIGATDKMMVDETGLAGHYYDFSIKLMKDKDGPTLEQQIEDGLGLRVEERKVPVPTVVIDTAVKPGEN